MDTMRVAMLAPKLRRTAIKCGAIPLGIGLGFFVAWLVTRDFSFVYFGFFLIFPLLVVIGYGFLALLGYAIAAHIDRRVKTPRFWPSFLLAALLLGSNFPAAYAVRHATETIGTQYRIEI
jgi:hypothetical protein